MIYHPHGYQIEMQHHIERNPFAGLFVDMGLGKTVVTLTALRNFLFDNLETNKILVIAPKRVAEVTWPDEKRKWNHTKGLRMQVIHGTAAQRVRRLYTKADIYVIGRDNLVWLVNYYGRHWPFKTVVIDELSSFKNSESKRFKALRRVRPLMHRVIGLTGTPAPKSLMDLWSQIYLLDRGERFGKTITGYREMFFEPGERNGYTVYNWNCRQGCDVQIHGLVSDICISMKAKDYLQLPGRIEQNVEIELPAELREQYRQLKRDAVLELGDAVITAANAAGVMNKLAQFCNGATYVLKDVAEGEKPERTWRWVHQLKIEAVRDDLEATGDQPFLLLYQFQHDRDRLMRDLAEFQPRELLTATDIRDWKAGKIKLAIAHPASMGHGLNLQDGGRYIGWFGLTWDLELYLQANARLDRQGQTKPVIIRRYLVKGSVEYEMLASLEGKDETQNSLLAACRRLKDEILGTAA